MNCIPEAAIIFEKRIVPVHLCDVKGTKVLIVGALTTSGAAKGIAAYYKGDYTALSEA